MTLYFYLRHFPPYGEPLNDGLKKAVHGLAAAMVANGAEVTVLSEGSSEKDSSFKTPAGYTVECFNNPIQYELSFKFPSALKNYICSHINQDDLVVLNGIFHPTIYSISRLLKKQKIPYIVAPHDVYHPDIFDKNPHVKLTYWYLLEKRLLQQARGIQVLEKSQEKWLKQRGIRPPIFEVPNGFLETHIYSESILRWSKEETIKLLYFGRIDTHHKGLDLLISAFSEVTAAYDTHLTIQGPEKGDKATLQQQAELLLKAANISFLPPEYIKPSPLVMAEHDIFCLPSRFEGFGMAAMEAMMVGRVLLVSEEAGIAKYVKASGCGVVVKPEVSAIRDGLLELCQRRLEWQEMGLKGRHYVLEHLGWEKIAVIALTQYQSLLPHSDSQSSQTRVLS